MPLQTALFIKIQARTIIDKNFKSVLIFKGTYMHLHIVFIRQMQTKTLIEIIAKILIDRLL